MQEKDGIVKMVVVEWDLGVVDEGCGCCGWVVVLLLLVVVVMVVVMVVDGFGSSGWLGTKSSSMGGARMAFCGQFSMCLYAAMCYRFVGRSPVSVHSVPYQTLLYSAYSKLCER
ncbi:hypothetical protein M0804_003552 [Polistes exclamans]|nr:hypothetical protein M0804_003552 [Polistes exclamans]